MLTNKQQVVLDTISEYIAKYGRSPTIDELQDILGQKSKRGVTQYLDVLEKKGFISRGRGFRSIKLGNSIGFQTMLSIPILGLANAGRALVYADESEYGSLPVSREIIKGDEKKYFCLKVEGTSMNNYMINGKYIENGSVVLIDRGDEALNNKDVFLFIVDGAATIKKFKKEGEYIYLLPDSRDDYHNPIVLTSGSNFFVNGKVVDVFNFNN